METKTWLFIAILVISVVSIVVVFLVIYYSSSFVPRRPSVEGIDLFGIDEIYPTKEGGREWFVDMKIPFLIISSQGHLSEHNQTRRWLVAYRWVSCQIECVVRLRMLKFGRMLRLPAMLK